MKDTIARWSFILTALSLMFFLLSSLYFSDILLIVITILTMIAWCLCLSIYVNAYGNPFEKWKKYYKK